MTVIAAASLAALIVPSAAVSKRGLYVSRSSSSAHPTIPHAPFSKMTVREIERYQLRLISLDRWVIRTRLVHYPQVVAFSRHRLGWTSRELAQTRRHLRATSSAGGGSHVQGWLCIHRLEGAWNSQTGNGFYGGLQMTYGWMGVVGNAALLSPGQQIAIADRVARQHGYASSWMAGQWPNTYPPCAGYF